MPCIGAFALPGKERRQLWPKENMNTGKPMTASCK
nr:MAG TPA: hypothetical protein [Caudoviricetes sp.]